jgi:Plasmid replication region DNA-binding N-term
MGRAGVTLVDVEKAVLQLQGRGKNPSVDAVREILGTGSKSTIAQHLRDIRSKQSEAQGNLPQQLLSLVTGLWERLNSQADERITEIEITNEQKIKELMQSFMQLQKDHAHLNQQFHQSEEEGIRERLAKEKLEKELQKEQQQHTQLVEKHEVMIEQLEDYKKDNTRLHQLAKNIQANLEHYHNAMQQLRTEQNLVIEKQQIQFQQELSELKREIVLYQKQKQESDLLLLQRNTAFDQLNTKYDSLQLLHDNQIKELQTVTKELCVFKDRYDQQIKQLQITQEKIKEKNEKLIELEKQNAILNSQCESFKKNLIQAEDKIEKLRDEKLFLTQEKSDLLRQVKQLEKAS